MLKVKMVLLRLLMATMWLLNSMMQLKVKSTMQLIETWAIWLPDGKQQVKDLAAWNVVANNEMAEKVEGGNTVKFIDGDNISITQNGKRLYHFH